MMGMNNMGGARPAFNNMGGMQQQSNYKIRTNVRNAEMNNTNMPMPNAQGLNIQNQMNPNQAGDTENAGTINLATLARMEKTDQKQTIGEQLYPKVKALVMSDERAGKITGMLLELDNEDFLSILEPMADKNLRAKVDEAALVLQGHAE